MKIINQNGQIRIKDIAERANVSIGTVDRVLHKRGEVSEATKKKILKIIEELDYKPNILASTLASKKSLTFATLLPKPPSPDGYWNKPLIGMHRAIDELKQYGANLVSFSFAQDNSKEFYSEAKKIIELQPEGVVLAPFFYKESNLIVDELKEKKIPFVFIDSNIEDAGQIGYIGQNSFQCGYLAGKLLDYIIPEKKSILVLHLAKEMDNQNHLVQREKGFYEWFKINSNSTHQVYTAESNDINDPVSYEKIIQVVKEKNIAGIFVTNSKVFLIGKLLKNSGMNQMKLIGHDLVKENIEYLKEGVVDFLICQRPEEQGFNAISKLFRHVVQKENVANENYTSIDIITKENVDYYKEF